MWSHYADNHKGLCIEFDRDAICEIGDYVQDVNYSLDISKVHILSSTTKKEFELMTLDSLFTKSLLWSYEKEFRVLKESSENFIEFPISAIKSVIFGISNESFRDQKLLERFSKMGITVQYANKSVDKFEIDIDNVRSVKGMVTYDFES
ncbi:DUF2971 domain-containing protein [Halobacteriovorax sp. HFRX-2_2]|uniref:DUF2971 domain-containing protein n=1 Tax=unclassified Halobacteriovorax TaxID=2639665 RepID=UPI0037200E9D